MLLSVPSEILNNILFYFDVDDPAIDNLSNTCKLIHSLLDQSIENYLNKTYSRTLSIFGPHDRSTDPFRALRKILSRPRLAHHFTHLSVGIVDSYHNRPGDAWTGQLTDFGGSSERNNVDCFYGTLGHLIFNSRYIPEQKKQGWFDGLKRAYEAWKNVVDYGESWYTAASLCTQVWEASIVLLLVILPNLQKLTSGVGGGRRVFCDIVIQLGQRSRKSTKSLHRPLGKLSMMHNTWMDQQCHWSVGTTSLVELIPFAMLPSMLTLNGTVLQSSEEEVNALWPYDFQNSTVTHLNLNCCKLSAAALVAFLGRFTSLRSFKCCFGGGTWSDVDYTPPSLSVVRYALLEAASSTLENLTIDSHDTKVDGRFGYVGSLCGFKVLKTISLDADLLIRDGKFQLPEDILPRSVEVLRVGLNSAGQQFYDLPELRPAHFPAFREVTTYHRLIGNHSIDRCMQDDLKRQRVASERCETCHIVTGEWRLRGCD
ncbi:hypothetical protein MMC18_006356 [Xylographa bjoerkii]|nr:hypothetical protein [Xylographa bjoerkii]